MVSKQDVLEFVQLQGERGQLVDAAQVSARTGLSIKAASRHLDRLWREGCITPVSTTKPGTPVSALRFKLTTRGVERLAVYRGEGPGADAAQGTIRFR